MPCTWDQGTSKLRNRPWTASVLRFRTTRSGPRSHHTSAASPNSPKTTAAQRLSAPNTTNIPEPVASPPPTS